MPILLSKSGSIAKRSALALFLAAATAAGGCGFAGVDGVELQGGVFDAMGMSGSNKQKMSDVKVDARPGLVLPPTTDRLPDPVTGSIAAAPQTEEAWPVDPEDRKAQARADLDKRHKAYCERALQDARMRGESGVVMGPKGNCQPGMFGALIQQVEGR